MFFQIAIIILSALVILFPYLILQRGWKGCPPGPRFLFPILANAPLTYSPSQHNLFSKWISGYGPIMKIEIGSRRFVIISDLKLLIEAFSKPSFSGRTDLTGFLNPIGDGKSYGLIGSEGDQREDLHHFSSRQLKEFGFGKRSLENCIMREVDEFVELLQKHGERPVKDIRVRFQLAVVNSLWFILTGGRQRQDDPAFLSRVQRFNSATDSLLNSPTAALLFFAPTIGHKILPGLNGIAKFRNAYQELMDLARKEVIRHRKDRVPAEEDRDFTDAFLREMESTTDPTSPFFGEKGEKSIRCVLADLYMAGWDTSSTVLTWLVLYLAKMPYIQQRFQAEITAVSRDTRAISLADKPKMPYTAALISELQRYASLIPAVPRKTLNDEVLHGYNIPKGVDVISNVSHIHNDPKIWGDPWNFRPERFLSPDETEYRRNEALIPYSVGKRQCIGEALARDTLFLFATNLFQKFKVQFDPDGPDQGLEARIGLFVKPKEFHVIFRDRQT